VTGTGLAVLIDPINGAAGRVAVDATAFAHRNALASVQIYSSGDDPTRVDELRDALRPQLGSHGYVNYIDPSMPDWQRAYYGPNFGRLRSIAAAHDPQHVFAFAQNVNQ
jgi:hypothetical protein